MKMDGDWLLLSQYFSNDLLFLNFDERCAVLVFGPMDRVDQCCRAFVIMIKVYRVGYVGEAFYLNIDDKKEC